jgi:hypothetical protein
MKDLFMIIGHIMLFGFCVYGLFTLPLATIVAAVVLATVKF